MSFDKIHLKGVTAKGYHGFYDTERAVGQNFVVDVVMDVDCVNASIEDDLDKTVDYEKVGRAIVRAIEGEPVKLIETLAERIALVVLCFDNVIEVSVTVHKPQAPLDYEFKDVALSIVRNRSNLKISFENSAYFIKRVNFLEEEADKTLADNSVNLDVELEENTENTLLEETNSDVYSTQGIQTQTQATNDYEKELETDSALDTVSNQSDTFEEPELKTDIIDVTQEGCNDYPPIFEPQKSSVILALGGNLGNPVELFQDVISDLDRSLGFDVLDVSPLVKTKAHTLNDEEQPDYYNCVLRGETFLRPSDLLGLVKEVEYYFGRREHAKWQARLIDIDIISYNNQKYEDEELTIPHKLAKQRAFVLYPWYLMENEAELDGEKVADLLEKTDDRDGILHTWEQWLGKSYAELENAGVENQHIQGEQLSDELVRILDDDIDVYTGDEIYEQNDSNAIGNVSEEITTIDGVDLQDNIHYESQENEYLDTSLDDSNFDADNLYSVDIPDLEVFEDEEDNYSIASGEQGVAVSDEDPISNSNSDDEINQILNTIEHTKVMNQLRTLFTNGVEDSDLLPQEEIHTHKETNIYSKSDDSGIESATQVVRIPIAQRMNKHVGNYESEVIDNSESTSKPATQKASIYEALRKKTFEEAMAVREPDAPYTFKPKWQSLEKGE